MDREVFVPYFEELTHQWRIYVNKHTFCDMVLGFKKNSSLVRGNSTYFQQIVFYIHTLGSEVTLGH